MSEDVVQPRTSLSATHSLPSLSATHSGAFVSKKRSEERKSAVQRPSVAFQQISKLGFNVRFGSPEDIDKVRTAAHKGITSAQFTMGLLYQKGLGVDKNIVEALAWFKRAADQGHAPSQRSILLACRRKAETESENFQTVKEMAMKDDPIAQNALGMMYEEGNGDRQSDAWAAEWYTKAANHGHADAEYNLALMYQNGKGVDHDDAIAAEWFMKAAEHGQSMAENTVGSMYERGHCVQQDYDAAAEWYAKAARQGLPEALSNLGSMYQRGLGVEQSDAKALDFFMKAAAQGHARAHMQIGRMYEHGAGVKQSLKNAQTWYHRIALQCYAPAQFKLGKMYEAGQGFKKSDKMAFCWYKKASEQGHADAQNNLGTMFELGRGVDQSDEDAAEWYQKAAEKGHADAQHNIGLMYQAGWGVSKNVTQAILWHAKAAKQGHFGGENALRIAMAKKFKNDGKQDLQSLLIKASSLEVKRASSDRKGINFSLEDTLPDKIVDFQMNSAIVEEVAGCLVTKLGCFGLEMEQGKKLAKQMKLYRFSAHEFVVQEGDSGNYFFIVHEGEFHVSKDGNIVATLGPGIGFGEIALVHCCPRIASVLAATDGASCWGVDKETFRHHLEKNQEKSYEDNRYVLDNVRLLDGLTKLQKDDLTHLAILSQVFEAGQTIVTQGEEGRCMYIIKSGECAIIIGGTRNPKTLLIEGGKEVARVKDGQCFGERALIYGEPRAASVKATMKSELLSIDHKLLYKVIGSALDSLLQQNMICWAFKGESAIFNRFSDAQQVQLAEKMQKIPVLAAKAVPTQIQFFVVLEGSIQVKLVAKDRVDAVITRGKCWGDEYIRNGSLPVDYIFVAGNDGATVASLTSKGLSKALKKSHFRDGISVEDVWDLNFKAEVASKHWFFQYLPLRKLRCLTQVMESRTHNKGARIVEQGAPGTKFFLIASGQLKVSGRSWSKGGAVSGAGETLILNEHECFGERALLFGEPWAVTAEVITPTAQVWALDRADFNKVFDRRFLDQLKKEIHLQDKKFDFVELVRSNLVSNGTFGIVKYVKAKGHDGKLYDTGCALKCFNKKVVAKHGKKVETEEELLLKIRHPFIISLVQSFPATKTWSYELLEMMTGGELFPPEKKHCMKVDVSQAKFYFGAVFLALEYLHLRHILYRNLKAEHVLLDSQGYPKLIDFTNAKKLPRGGRTRSTVGIPHYMSPEVIQGKPYRVGVDYWALGVFLYAMLVGELPFGKGAKNPMEIFAQVTNTKDNSMPALGVSNAGNLCRGLLEPKLEQRLAAGHIHPVLGCEDIRESSWFDEPAEHGGSSGEKYFDHLIIRAVDPPLVPPDVMESLVKIKDSDNKEIEDLDNDDNEPASPKSAKTTGKKRTSDPKISSVEGKKRISDPKKPSGDDRRRPSSMMGG